MNVSGSHSSDKSDKSDECISALFKTLAGDPLDIRAHLIQEKGQRVQSTCEWIRKNDTYRTWMNSRTQLLWLSGGPGKGKTMFAIFLTQELEQVVARSANAVLTYFFCGSSDKRNTAMDVLRGIIFRLLMARPHLFQHVKPRYDVQGEFLFADSSLEAVWSIFEQMVRDPSLEAVYCVLDGLDECVPSSLKVLLEKLTSLFRTTNTQPLGSCLKLLCISREYPECLPGKLSGYPRLKLDPDSDAEVGSDLKQYISVKVDELSAEKNYPEEVRRPLENKLIQRAGGTFLWVAFAVEELKDRTSTEVEDAIDNFPPGLDGLYSRMLIRVPDRRRDIVALILRWVVVAARPLSLTELSAVTGVKSALPEDRERVIREQISFCGPLLSVVGKLVHLVHASARDYLVRGDLDPDPRLEYFRMDEGEANAAVAQQLFIQIQSSFVSDIIARVMNFQSFKFREREFSDLLAVLDQRHALASYAVIAWLEHARRSCSRAYVFDLSSSFFDENSLLRKSWFRMYWHMQHHDDWPEAFTLLHLAAYIGAFPLAQKLLERPSSAEVLAEVNAEDSTGRSPLFYGVDNCHEAMVLRLLKGGARAETKDRRGDTPLIIATSRGRATIVKYLIDNSANLEAVAEHGLGGTPLLIAAKNGDDSTVGILLKHGADVEASIWSSDITPLLSAADLGHEGVVSLLLEAGADIRARNSKGKTALHLACEGGHTATVMRLLAQTKEVRNTLLDVRDKDQRTALHSSLDFPSPPSRSLYESRRDIALILLESARPDELNAADKYGLTPLHLAARGKDGDIIKMILNRGGNLAALDNSGKFPLHHAVAAKWWVNLEVIDILLRSSAQESGLEGRQSGDPERVWKRDRANSMDNSFTKRAADSLRQRDENGQTPLHIAVTTGAFNVVRFLLENKIDVTIRDRLGRTALDLAARNGSYAMIELVSRGFSNAPLHEAARTSDIACLSGLVAKGQDLTLAGLRGRTALHQAAECGRTSAVDFLLRNGAAISIKDVQGQTPLHLAASGGHVDIVRTLLGAQVSGVGARLFRYKGVKVDEPDYIQQTPLHLAVEHGSVPVAEVLVKADANVNHCSSSSSGRYPIHRAAERNQGHMLKFLLASGADVDAIDDILGNTALHIAAQNGSTDAVEILLDSGASIDKQERIWRCTPLLRASQNGHQHAFELLLRRGADPTISASDGRTPLHWAAENGQTTVMQLLLDRNVDCVASEVYFGATPLHLAAIYGHSTAVEMLLSRMSRTDIMLRSREFGTALDCAVLRHHHDIKVVLEEKLKEQANTDESDDRPAKEPK
jgi:ankyrin repeat protein